MHQQAFYTTWNWCRLHSCQVREDKLCLFSLNKGFRYAKSERATIRSKIVIAERVSCGVQGTLKELWWLLLWNSRSQMTILNDGDHFLNSVLCNYVSTWMLLVSDEENNIHLTQQQNPHIKTLVWKAIFFFTYLVQKQHNFHFNIEIKKSNEARAIVLTSIIDIAFVLGGNCNQTYVLSTMYLNAAFWSCREIVEWLMTQSCSDEVLEIKNMDPSLEKSREIYWHVERWLISLPTGPVCCTSQLWRGTEIQTRLHMSVPTNSQARMWICCYCCSFWLHLLQYCVCVWDLFPSQTFNGDLAGRPAGTE